MNPDSLRALAASDADIMNPWGNNDTCQRPRVRS